MIRLGNECFTFRCLTDNRMVLIIGNGIHWTLGLKRMLSTILARFRAHFLEISSIIQSEYFMVI